MGKQEKEPALKIISNYLLFLEYKLQPFYKSKSALLAVGLRRLTFE